MRNPLHEKLDCFFNPESVAVIGASEHYGKWGCGIFYQASKSNGRRRVYPVNATSSEVFGVKTYKSVKDIPEPVDLAVIAVPNSKVISVMKDCVESNVKSALVVTAGFSEMGEEGEILQRELVKTSRKGSIPVIGPNCMGHLDTYSELITTMVCPPLNKGGIGLVAQSGNMGLDVLQAGTDEGLGFSKFVSSGNEADVCLEDLIEYLADDEQTKVIVAYIEGLRNGRRFFELAKQITKKKPIVVVKSGRTESGSRAAKSHSAALAGSDAIHSAAFRQAGVIRANNVTELVDIAGALMSMPLPQGRRVGIVTGGGGFGVAAADGCEQAGLEVAQLSPVTIEKIDKLLPDYWSRTNPIDMVATGGIFGYQCLDAVLEDENIDAVLSLTAIGAKTPMRKIEDIAHPSIASNMEESLKAAQQQELGMLDTTLDLMYKSQKPILVSLVAPETRRNAPALRRLRELGIQVYPSPERVARTLGHLVWYSEYLKGVI